MTNKILEECRKPGPMSKELVYGCETDKTNILYESAEKIAADNGLPLTTDVLIAILRGYERGHLDCAEFIHKMINEKFGLR